MSETPIEPTPPIVIVVDGLTYRRTMSKAEKKTKRAQHMRISRLASRIELKALRENAKKADKPHT